VSELTIDEESIDSNGALSILHAASDELRRRYGGDGDDGHLHVAELRGPSGLFLVARLDGDLVGGVGLRAVSDRDTHVAEIKRLWVRPDLRRQGVAAALMNAVEERARQLHYVRLYLETGWMQPEAVALYDASGWTRIDDYPTDVFCHPNSYRFTKEL
jgi:GNAT superfamily N-acetyltransferase